MTPATPEQLELVRTALALRASVSYAAIKKVATMLACVGPGDNRVRGLLNHHGATTGRSTNSLVQFQNMKRPTIDNSEAAYRDICAGVSREMLEIVYGPPLEVISSCIRHFVEDTPAIRYFIHPESDCYFTTIDGSHPGTDGCVEEVTEEEYHNFMREVS